MCRATQYQELPLIHLGDGLWVLRRISRKQNGKGERIKGYQSLNESSPFRARLPSFPNSRSIDSLPFYLSNTNHKLPQCLSPSKRCHTVGSKSPTKGRALPRSNSRTRKKVWMMVVSRWAVLRSIFETQMKLGKA